MPSVATTRKGRDLAKAICPGCQRQDREPTQYLCPPCFTKLREATRKALYAKDSRRVERYAQLIQAIEAGKRL